jgi:hypothetical protein
MYQSLGEEENTSHNNSSGKEGKMIVWNKPGWAGGRTAANP